MYTSILWDLLARTFPASSLWLKGLLVGHMLFLFPPSQWRFVSELSSLPGSQGLESFDVRRGGTVHIFHLAWSLPWPQNCNLSDYKTSSESQQDDWMVPSISESFSPCHRLAPTDKPEIEDPALLYLLWGVLWQKTLSKKLWTERSGEI